MLWLLWVGRKIHFSIQTHRHSPLTSDLRRCLCSLSLPSLCEPAIMHSLPYAQFTAHDSPESPDEAEWKWVQQSYDRGRRNQPHNNRSLTHSLAVSLTGIFSPLQCVMIKFCSNPKPNFLLRHQPWCLTPGVRWNEFHKLNFSAKTSLSFKRERTVKSELVVCKTFQHPHW